MLTDIFSGKVGGTMILSPGPRAKAAGPARDAAIEGCGIAGIRETDGRQRFSMKGVPMSASEPRSF